MSVTQSSRWGLATISTALSEQEAELERLRAERDAEVSANARKRDEIARLRADRDGHGQCERNMDEHHKGLRRELAFIYEVAGMWKAEVYRLREKRAEQEATDGQQRRRHDDATNAAP
jgi:hypothetical protein